MTTQWTEYEVCLDLSLSSQRRRDTGKPAIWVNEKKKDKSNKLPLLSQAT